MPAKDNFQGVSNCYVFKSRLQEYAQKVGLPTPAYETTKEGPSHEPTFHSTVIVNDVRYNSLPGFSNRKAAEQSAAEVALVELSKASDFSPGASQPVHETGLCKNMLQEYAQKMNFAIPLYQCQKDGVQGKSSLFSCTVEIGGIRYIGAVAKTKKEAEIKAARTALLAIQLCPTELSKKSVDHVQLTVIPCKRREVECLVKPKITKALKGKKGRFKTASRKRMRNGLVKLINTSHMELKMDSPGVATFEASASGFQTQVYVESARDTMQSSECGITDLSSSNIVVQAQVNVESAKDTVQSSENGITDLCSSERVVQAQVNMESAKDTMQSSECGITYLGSSNRVVPIDSDTPVQNGNFENGHSGASDSYQTNHSSDVMNLFLPDMQTACCSEENVAS